MPTRAPAVGVDDVYATQIVDDLVEPIGITIRNLSEGDIKVIFWFIAKAEEGLDKVHGTQMAAENFASTFVDAQEAVGRLTFENERNIVRRALALVAT